MDLCGAKTRKGTPCRRTAGAGTDHPGVGKCRNHGGSSPQAQLSGVLVLARAEAVAMGNPLDIEPHEAILQCIRVAAGEVRYASDRIAELAEHEVAGPTITSVDREGFGEHSATYSQRTEGPPALHIWVRARHEAMDRLVLYSKTALNAGVEERRVRVAESVGEAMADLIRGVLADLGHDLHDPKTREIVGRHLQLVQGGAA